MRPSFSPNFLWDTWTIRVKKRPPSLSRIGVGGLVGISFLFLGMAGGRGSLGRGALRAEIRLKLSEEAISHYERAEALDKEGRLDEALREIRKAVKVINDFPEAHQLAKQIYFQIGKEKEAKEEEKLWLRFQGDKGASLYQVREKLIQEIEFRKKNAPPPDLKLLPSLTLCGGGIAILILGLVYEYRRMTRRAGDETEHFGIFLGKFPGEEKEEFHPSGFFKLCVLLLPAPFLFALLVLLGFRYYSDLLPVFFLTFAVAEGVVYFLYMADLRDLGGFRGGRPGIP